VPVKVTGESIIPERTALLSEIEEIFPEETRKPVSLRTPELSRTQELSKVPESVIVPESLKTPEEVSIGRYQEWIIRILSENMFESVF